MDRGADMMRDQSQDALGIGRRNDGAGRLKPARETIDPESSVRVQHHFVNARIFEVGGNHRPHCGSQHPGAAEKSFGVE
jgi:hypothetical protein